MASRHFRLGGGVSLSYDLSRCDSGHESLRLCPLTKEESASYYHSWRRYLGRRGPLTR